jgi:hypothetical protein
MLGFSTPRDVVAPRSVFVRRDAAARRRGPALLRAMIVLRFDDCDEGRRSFTKSMLETAARRWVPEQI